MSAAASAKLRTRISVPIYLIAALILASAVWTGLNADTWTADDAFISFRYAKQLNEGHGLVFNVGERVEGYSNFLWTLWSAVGLRLGLRAETWTHYWGLAFWIGTILVLGLNHLQLRRRFVFGRWTLPMAAMGLAFHPDGLYFATSGLETAAFTFFLLLGFLVAAWNHDSRCWMVVAALCMGIASLLRPEGVLPAMIIGVYVFVVCHRRRRSVNAYLLTFFIIWLSFIAWRVWYYGELMPNTYWAKSGGTAWYSQGLRYTMLYFERYWPLLAAPLLWLVVLVTGKAKRIAGSLFLDHAMFAALIAAAYTFYVVRVGGDFMFARFLVPATPFYLLLFEYAFLVLFWRRLIHTLVPAAVFLAGMLLTPTPVGGQPNTWRYGIADEHAYYSPETVQILDRKSEVLKRYFDGLPVRVAFYGSEARVVYKADFPIAIESHAGLTDPVVSRQPLPEVRKRVGHEKHAPIDYLIRERKAHITFSREAQRLLQLDQHIPRIIVDFGERFTGQVLWWDASLMDEIARRGAKVPPFLELLDRYIAQLDSFPIERVQADYRRFRLFYFDHVDDDARSAAFRARLAAP